MGSTRKRENFDFHGIFFCKILQILSPACISLFLKIYLYWKIQKPKITIVDSYKFSALTQYFFYVVKPLDIIIWSYTTLTETQLPKKL